MSSIPQPKGSRQPRPWYAYITLDFIVHILSRSVFHPAIVYIFYLCLASVHKHTKPFASYVLYWCGFLILIASLRWLDHRATYGKPRKVDWANEVAIVTGGASGLGRVLVEMLLRKGAQVAVFDVQEQDGDAVELEDVGLLWCKCDVGNARDVAESCERVQRELGPPTILINNAAASIAGRSLFRPPSLSTPSSTANTLQTNTLSHFHTLSHFLPSVLKDPPGPNQRSATIVTISSILTHLCPPNLSSYTASKAAISSLHHTLTHELHAAGLTASIKTILVEIGQMDTPLFAGTKLPWYAGFLGPTLQAKDVAVAIVGVLERGTGGVVRMPVYARLMPWYGVMPGVVKRGVRWVSGIDGAIQEDGGDDKKAA